MVTCNAWRWPRRAWQIHEKFATSMTDIECRIEWPPKVSVSVHLHQYCNTNKLWSEIGSITYYTESRTAILANTTVKMSDRPSNDGQEEQRTPNIFEPRFEPAGPPRKFEDISKERQATSQSYVATSSSATFSPPSSQQVEPSVSNQELQAEMFAAPATRWKIEDMVHLMKLVAGVPPGPIAHLPWDQIDSAFNDSQRSYRTQLALQLKYRSLVNMGESVASLERKLINRQWMRSNEWQIQHLLTIKNGRASRIVKA